MFRTLWSSSFRLIITAVCSFMTDGTSLSFIICSALVTHSPITLNGSGKRASNCHRQFFIYKSVSEGELIRRFKTRPINSIFLIRYEISQQCPQPFYLFPRLRRNADRRSGTAYFLQPVVHHAHGDDFLLGVCELLIIITGINKQRQSS